MKNLENLTINDYISIFRRRFWYLAVTTALVSAASVAFVLQLPSVYKSETTILMSSRLLPEDYIRSIDRQTPNERMEFVRQQLQSRSFLAAIVEDFNLAEPGRLDGVERASDAVRGRTEITPLNTSAFKIGYSSTDPSLAQRVTSRLAERVIQLNDSFRKEKVQTADTFLQEQLLKAGEELTQAERNLFEFRNRSFPGIAGEAVTLDNLRDLQGQLATLDNQLKTARDQRQSLERRLQESRQLTTVMKAPSAPVAPKPASPQQAAAPTALEQTLAGKRMELASAQVRYTPAHPQIKNLTREVEDLEAAVKMARAATVVATPATPAPSEPSLTATLPELEASLNFLPAEIQSELDQVNRDISQAEQTRSALASKLYSHQAWLNPPPSIAQQQGALTRAYDSAKQRYTYLSNQRLTSEMAVSVDSSEENEMFKVVDAAFLPQRPIGPNRRMLASVGGLVGLLLGLGIAFVRDYIDTSLHSEEEALAELKLPILASIPTISEDGLDERMGHLNIFPVQNDYGDPATFSLRYADPKIRSVLLSPVSVVGEHYRLLHSKLLEMQRERKLKTILISSAAPGEGKTFSSCCLAGILAQEPGKKVLLIDADFRRSTATKMFGLHQRKSPNNFSNVLRGLASFDDSIVRCEELNLYFLPSGTITSNPLEILNSPQFERVLRQYTETFDWVIVDSAPIMAVADANVMYPSCDGMLLVVYSGRTPVKYIKDSVQRIGRDRICGIVMNHVRNVSSYQYGSYYQRPAAVMSKLSKLSTLKLHDGE